MSWFDGVRARLRLLAGRSAEKRMQREFGFHMEMEAERLVREEGLAPAEARRRAAVAFGGVEKYTEELRSDRGFSWLKGTVLDLKLGLRLLFKNPGFTLVSGLGIMVATAFMSGLFAFFYSNIYPKLPLPEGDRLVGLENWDVRVNNEEQRSLHDFILWRSQMKSVVEISAFHEFEASLFIGTTAWPTVRVASMTASAFRLARVAPALGRYLAEADEREGAADVLVIGYEAWRDRFEQDRNVVGSVVRLGRQVYTIVGVMPEGYGFPVNHQYWVPFRLDPLKVPRGEGPRLFVFGRLAPGASEPGAQAELKIIGERMAAQFPLTNEKLRPMVWPFTAPLIDIQGAGPLVLVQTGLMSGLVLFVVAMNIAILVYARTAMRRGEIAIRTALGASRTRIVVQLFLEALVLALVPALLGIPLTQYGLRVGDSIMSLEYGGQPFWTDLSLQPVTVFYTLFLVVIAAAVIGVLPALRATGRHVQADIRQLGGSGGMKLGRVWTLMIATQVAVAVAALPQVVKLGLGQMHQSLERPNFHGEFVSFGAELTEAYDSTGAAEANALFGARITRLLARLASDRDLAGVTISGRVPYLESRKQIEVASPEGPGGASVYAPSSVAAAAGVDTARFNVLGLPMLAGRGFDARDVAPGASSAIVNRSFVRQVLQGGSAVGHRLRYMGEDDGGKAASPGRWHEIIGVVEDMNSNPLNPDAGRANIYFPVAPSQLRAASVLARLKPSVTPTLAQRLPAMIAAEMPELRVGPMGNVDWIDKQDQLVVRLVAMITILVMVSVLLLSAAGIYALMSFTVTQRWREIGIRSALGATPPRVLAGMFSRVAVQIGLGIVVGIGAALALDPWTGKDVPMTGALIPAVVVIITVVGFVAAAGPARRGLRIQPIDALKSQ
ncbi:MAG: ABC transporter permease [Gemmatimonadota bacterium]